ncbi:MAG: carboxymuconolactone decarboxylase family protein [Acidimicrobiales bacterium]
MSSENSNRPVRIAGQTPSEWTAATRAVFDTTVSTTRQRPLHLPSVIAHHQAWIGPYIEWAKAVALEGLLEPRATALLALRCAHNCRSGFEWGVHTERAVTSGALSDDEIVRVAAGPDASGWTDSDAALLQAADDLHAGSTIGADAWSVLAVHHGQDELVEICLTVGHYTMLSMMANTAGVPSEAHWAGLDEAPPRPAAG